MLIKEIDYGTPARTSSAMVTLEIDGEQVTVPAGTSVMRAAVDAGHPRCRSCARPTAWKPFGSCRLCLVEIEGRKGTPASCTTPVEPGMKVRTQTAAARQAAPRRDGALHLRPSARLPDLRRQRRLRAAGHGGRGRPARSALRLSTARTTSTRRRTNSNPYFTFDPTKCIVCSRCVRACEEVQGTFALTIDGRGFASHVSAGQDQAVPGFRVRLLRRLRAGLPDRDADGEDRHRAAASRSTA